VITDDPDREDWMIVEGPYGTEKAPKEQPVQIGVAVLAALYNLRVDVPRPYVPPAPYVHPADEVPK
jgi:hypothetical protein